MHIQFRSQSLSNRRFSLFPRVRASRRRREGVRDPGDKSRATPFKSREAYVKCTRDNRLSARVCLTFLSGSRCLHETRRGCLRERAFVKKRHSLFPSLSLSLSLSLSFSLFLSLSLSLSLSLYLSLSLSPRSRFILAVIPRGWSLPHILVFGLLSIHDGICSESNIYWLRSDESTVFDATTYIQIC